MHFWRKLKILSFVLKELFSSSAITIWHPTDPEPQMWSVSHSSSFAARFFVSNFVSYSFPPLHVSFSIYCPCFPFPYSHFPNWWSVLLFVSHSPTPVSQSVPSSFADGFLSLTLSPNPFRSYMFRSPLFVLHFVSFSHIHTYYLMLCYL